MSRVLLAICLILLVGIRFGLAQGYEPELRRAAANLAAQMERSGQKSGTVLDFTDLQGQGTELGRFLAQELSDQLVATAKTVAFVDRANLQYLLRENKLSAEGLINPESSGRLGKLIGIDTVIYGTVTPIGNGVRLSVRAIAVETGKIVASNSVTIPALGELANLYSHGVVSNGAPGAPTGTAAEKRRQPDIRDRLRADSFKMMPDVLLANINAYYGTKLSVTVENRTGVGVGIALRKGGVSAGPCNGVQVAGLSVIDDNGINHLMGSAEPAKLMRWLPAQGRASVTIDFDGYQCPNMLSGVSTVPLTFTLVVASGKDVVVLPMTADKVPVRVLGNQFPPSPFGNAYGYPGQR